MKMINGRQKGSLGKVEQVKQGQKKDDAVVRAAENIPPQINTPVQEQTSSNATKHIVRDIRPHDTIL